MPRFAEAAGHGDGVVLGQPRDAGVVDGFEVDIVVDPHAHMVLQPPAWLYLVDRLA